MAQELRCGYYRHFKGGVYLVLGMAQHTETGERLVVYISLSTRAGVRMRARPLPMFLGDVEVDGTKAPRFEYVGAEMPDIKEETQVYE